MTASLSRDEARFRDIYLADHWAGAAAGSALAGRLAEENMESPWGADLAWIAEQIRTDQQSLAEIRQHLHSNGGGLKRAVALIGERVSRFTPNGRFVRYSPLSRVLEIEALISGVSAKQGLWVALQEIDRSLGLLAGFDLRELEIRGETQLELLHTVHQAAVAEAFGEPTTSGA